MEKAVIILILLIHFLYITSKCSTTDNWKCSSYELSEEEKQKDSYGNTPDTCCLVVLSEYIGAQLDDNNKFCYPLPKNKFKEYINYFYSNKKFLHGNYNLDVVTIKCGNLTHKKELRNKPTKSFSSKRRMDMEPPIPEDEDLVESTKSSSTYIELIKIGLIFLLFLYYMNRKKLCQYFIIIPCLYILFF